VQHILLTIIPKTIILINKLLKKWIFSDPMYFNVQFSSGHIFVQIRSSAKNLNANFWKTPTLAKIIILLIGSHILFSFIIIYYGLLLANGRVLRYFHLFNPWSDIQLTSNHEKSLEFDHIWSKIHIRCLLDMKNPLRNAKRVIYNNNNNGLPTASMSCSIVKKILEPTCTAVHLNNKYMHVFNPTDISRL